MKSGEGGMRPSIAQMEGWDGSTPDISWRAGRQDLAKRMTEAKNAFKAIQEKMAGVGQLRGGPCTLLEAARLLDKERKKEDTGREQGLSTWIKRQSDLARQRNKAAAAAAAATRGTSSQQALEEGAAAGGSGTSKQPRKKGAAAARGSSRKPRKKGAAGAGAAAASSQDVAEAPPDVTRS